MDIQPMEEGSTRREFELDLDMLETHAKSTAAARIKAAGEDNPTLLNFYQDEAIHNQSKADYYRKKILARFESERQENRELREALRALVLRCDGDEGVRADGSNIDTLAAHAVLGFGGR